MKKFWPWLFLAILVSLVFGFYHLTIPYWLNNDNYSPLVFNESAASLVTDEAQAYAPQVRDWFDGNLWPSDFLLWEYRNSPSPFLSNIIPIWIMGGLAKLAGDVTGGFILADFIWPTIVFLSLTYLIYRLTKKVYLAPAGALMTMFFGHYFNYLPFFRSILEILINNFTLGTYSQFVRSFHPQITLPFLIIFCFGLWQNKKPWLLGIALGLLFYTYIYYWTFALGWLGLLGLWALGTKQYELFKRLFLAVIIGLILALPYFWEMWQFQQLTTSQAFGDSYRFLPPLGIKGLLKLLIMIGFSHWLIKDRFEKAYWQLFYLTGLIMVTIVYGLNLSVDDPLGHWMDRVIYPLTAVFLVVWVIRKLKKNYAAGGIGLCLILLIYQGRSHWVYFKNSATVFQLEPARREAFDWLNEHTPKDSVVITTGLIDNLYLPIYTHNNLFAPFSYLSLAPQSEILERFLITYKAAGIDQERITEMFSLSEKNRTLKVKKRFNFDDCGGHYLFYRLFSGADFYNCSVPADQLEKILNDYQMIDGDLNHWQEKYRLDYWLWGPNEQKWATISPAAIAGWQEEWENEEYKIYKIK